ncbi:MAG: 3-hydroxyacyl-CoA dehydrogenase NAD-binding domain-containing protein, partial [Sphingobium sp.]
MTMNIQKVAVCGAGGTMGAGIALVAARAGFRTLCFDMSADALAHQRKAASEFFAKSVDRGKMTAEARDAAMENLVDTTALADLADCDLVIEAIFEDLGWL